MAAVVVRKRLSDERRAAGPDQIESTGRNNTQLIDGVAQKSRDHRIARQIGEIDEHPAARCVVRSERQAEQSLFAAATDLTGQVEEIGSKEHAVLHDADASSLLDDELDVGKRRILNEPDRRIETRDDQIGAKLGERGVRTAQACDDRNQKRPPDRAKPSRRHFVFLTSSNQLRLWPALGHPPAVDTDAAADGDEGIRKSAARHRDAGGPPAIHAGAAAHRREGIRRRAAAECRRPRLAARRYRPATSRRSHRCRHPLR